MNCNVGLLKLSAGNFHQRGLSSKVFCEWVRRKGKIKKKEEERRKKNGSLWFFQLESFWTKGKAEYVGDIVKSRFTGKKFWISFMKVFYRGLSYRLQEIVHFFVSVSEIRSFFNETRGMKVYLGKVKIHHLPHHRLISYTKFRASKRNIDKSLIASQCIGIDSRNQFPTI